MWVVGCPTHDERTATVDREHKLLGGTGEDHVTFLLLTELAIENFISPPKKQIIYSTVFWCLPTNMKCLPKKISSNYGFYTAKQWKNWTPIYSLYTLEGIFGDNHLQCWLLPSSYELNGFNSLKSLWRDSKSHQLRTT